jgi:uncharacterized oligopeptide transporter (OPT) family protein
MALLLNRGASALPAGALEAATLAFAIASLLAVAERASAVARRVLPSPVALGVGVLLPASYSLTILVGALVAAAAMRNRADGAKGPMRIVAAGAILGDTGVDVVRVLAG